MSFQGLIAISDLMKASANKWWRGSRLRLLEIINDGQPPPVAAATAAAATAATATGSGWVPSHGSSSMRQDAAAASRTAGAATAVGGGWTLAGQAVAGKGVARPLTASAAQGKSSFPVTAGMVQLTVRQQVLRDRAPSPGELRQSITSLRTSLELRSSLLLDTMNSWKQHMVQQGIVEPSQAAAPAQQQRPATAGALLAQSQRQQLQLGQTGQTGDKSVYPGLDAQGMTSLQHKHQETSAQHLGQSNRLVGLNQQLQQQQHQAAGTLVSAGVPSSTAMKQATATVPRFSAAAIQELALTLGMATLGLQVLVLDHCMLRDQALEILGTGLARCAGS